MPDLPDWYTQVQSATLRATSIAGGIDADKSASPVAEDVYLARDTGILYVCFVSGTWTNVGILYLLLAGGTMSGAIDMDSNRVLNLPAPSDNAEPARKLDVDTVDAKLNDVTASSFTPVSGTVYQNTSGKTQVITLRVRGSSTTSACVADLLSDASNPPTTRIGVAQHQGDADESANWWGTITLVVPPSYYYKVTLTNIVTPVFTVWTLF